MTKATKSKRETRAGGDEGGKIVSAVKLAAHLDVGRTFIPKLEATGVINRLPGGGYDLDAARVGYVRHLRRARAQSPKTAAEAEFMAARTKLLEIKAAEKIGALFPTEVALDIIDEFVAAVTIEIQSIAARVAPADLHLRRRIDAAVFEVRKAISERFAEKARQALPEVAESSE
jgi:hypothetical protein